MPKRKENGDAETAQVFRSLSDVPESNLSSVKKELKKIEKRTSSGKPCKSSMRQLLNGDMSDGDEMELDPEEEEEEARLVGGGSIALDDEDDEEENFIYRNRDSFEPTDKNIGQFDVVFSTACTMALSNGECLDFMKLEAEKDSKARSDLNDFDSWIKENIVTPLNMLNTVVSKNEDQNALFTQVKRSAALRFKDVSASGSKCTCIISGKKCSPDGCIEVQLIDDPTMFKDLQPKASSYPSSKPHKFIIQKRFSNLVYSAFHLRTLFAGIGSQCIHWVTENKLLKGHIPDIINSYREHKPDFLENIMQEVELSKATIEKYCKDE